jgi:hypothetical protein
MVQMSSTRASEEAERGTKLDAIIRSAFSGDAHRHKMIELEGDDLAACKWGVETLERLAAGHPIETREE